MVFTECTKLDDTAGEFWKCFWLKVNLQKTRLFRIGVTSAETQTLAAKIHCVAEALPFIYLRLPVGANMKRIAP